jgi:hypothetical protein
MSDLRRSTSARRAELTGTAVVARHARPAAGAAVWVGSTADRRQPTETAATAPLPDADDPVPTPAYPHASQFAALFADRGEIDWP